MIFPYHQSSIAATLIIPAYNEAERFLPALEAYAEAFRARYGQHYELLIVCNGCRDNTVELARAFAARHSQVRVLVIKAAVGKGGAVLEGFRHATGALVGFADADGATTPQSLLSLYDRMPGHDGVIGSRHLRSSVITSPQPLTRRIYSWGFGLLVRGLFQLPYADTQCGAKVFTQAAARELAQVVGERRWAFDVDLLLRAQQRSFDILEAPVVWADKEGSKLKVFSTIREVAVSLARLKLCGQERPATGVQGSRTVEA